MSTTECRCGRPTKDDAYGCEGERNELDRALGDCAWLEEELETTITRQRGAGTTGGPRGTETPLPWHERASEARRALHSTLATWVRFCEEEQVRGIATWQATDTLTSMARWLLHATRGLMFHELGPDAVDEITDAVAECERIVFWKKRARVYLGKCEQVVKDPETDEVLTLSCEGDVYAEEDQPTGQCEECQQGVTVVIRKAEIDKMLDDRLCTAADLSRMAVFLGLDVPRESVRKKVLYWHRHKRIISRSTEPDTDAPMFRYGEVKALLYAEFGRMTA